LIHLRLAEAGEAEQQRQGVILHFEIDAVKV
jgi:hypothetical protein